METALKHGQCYLDPRDNRAFQKIFGDNKVMLGFLNAAFAGKYKVTRITNFADPKMLLLGTDEDPAGVLLVHCSDDRGRPHIVEVRNCSKGNFMSHMGDFYMRERMLQEMASCVDSEISKVGRPVSVIGIVHKYDSNIRYMWMDADIGDENDKPVQPEFYGVIVAPRLAPKDLTECKDSLEQCMCLVGNMTQLESKVDSCGLPEWIERMLALAEA